MTDRHANPIKLAPRSERRALTISESMARIRSQNTLPERRVHALVRSLGHQFRKNVATLPGTPDLANKRAGWAIQVHGCFWHSHKGCKLASSPRSNSDYWRPKLKRNKERDRERQLELRRLGFRIIVVWECETRASTRLSSKIVRFFRSL